MDKLYRPSIPHTLHPQTEEEDEHSRFRLTVNGVTLIFEEGFSDVVLTIQGKLDAKAIKTIVKETAQQLSAVEGHSYTSTKLQ
ncbi:hypothetical protein [Rubritalea tangerina]|uniref:hypothetical protein n=1 Tax=Rubritalea tangerina TaxID=430798 RepID=UPI003608BC20